MATKKLERRPAPSNIAPAIDQLGELKLAVKRAQAAVEAFDDKPIREVLDTGEPVRWEAGLFSAVVATREAATFDAKRFAERVEQRLLDEVAGTPREAATRRWLADLRKDLSGSRVTQSLTVEPLEF